VTQTAPAIPDSIRSDIDLFSTSSLINPYPGYKELRDIGRIAYLDRYDIWAVTRYDEIKKMLTDPATFTVTNGNAVNPIVNEAWRGAAAQKTGPDHAILSKVMRQGLGLKVVPEYREKAEREAALLVDSLLEKQEFDAITDMAYVLPANIILDLLGISREVEHRDQLLGWASDTYNCCAPGVVVGDASYESMDNLYQWAKRNMVREKLNPEGITAKTFAAVDAGQIDDEQAWGIIVGYVTASLDTTASAVGSLMMLFLENPDQWEVLKSDPSLIPSTVSEGVRVESPAQWFSKMTTRDVEFDDGVVVPEGSWVLHVYGAANRDERKYPDPDTFDVRRNPIDHLGFGYGEHMCAGKHVSYLEEQALLMELIRRVDRFEPAGEPVRHVNNLMRGLEHLPMRVHPK
jgi:cytochrome P450